MPFAGAGVTSRPDFGGIAEGPGRSARRSLVHRAGVERAEAHGSAFEKKSLHAAERDSQQNRQRREEFVAKIRATAPEHLIFLDESGVTTSMTHIYARRPDGRRIHEATPGGHWKIMTILAAMRQRGIVAAMTIEEPTDGDIFLAYVEQVLCPTLAAGDVVVMDNLAAHKVNRVEELIQAQGAEVLYLPPYSPDLNPIEKAWSKIKQYLRSNRPRNTEALDQAISETIALITATDAQAWFRLVLAPLQ
jgi:transposase